jgi:Outer membrane protein
LSTAQKFSFKTLFAALLLVLNFSCVPAQAAPTPAAAGVVNFTYLIDHHPDTPTANQTLQVEQDNLKKEFMEKSANLSDSEKRELDRQFSQRLEQKRQELLKPIVDKLMAAVQEVANAKKLSIVVDKRQVVWGGIDITQDVLAKVNGK